jgi:hypothetical protein
MWSLSSGLCLLCPPLFNWDRVSVYYMASLHGKILWVTVGHREGDRVVYVFPGWQPKQLLGRHHLHASLGTCSGMLLYLWAAAASKDAWSASLESPVAMGSGTPLSTLVFQSCSIAPRLPAMLLFVFLTPGVLPVAFDLLLV